ncbi:PDZ domain-containing protein [Flavobacterium soli]|uniref:PDZ domain-containing protein n=1 Tax=Flavobacterium soli TaxID=344881 RepID=UPI0004294A23|nr:PDZ domain-containing protein [Flavobacterium soli]
MKLLTQLLCFLLCSPLLFAQDGFEFTTSKKKATIPFKLINNLIIVPIKVNGVELNFLLDTGVEETILFSLDEKEEVKLFNVQKIKLRGLGDEGSTEGLRSSKNILTLQGLKSTNHEILIILDEEFNFSSSLGIPVNGIIGSHFFRKNLIEINYLKKRIIIYNEPKINKEKLIYNYKPFTIFIENAKPYLQTAVIIDTTSIDAKCLIDTGNSDPVWLFENKSKNIHVPQKNFDDFLGRGFNGAIHGKRAKIAKLSMNEFEFRNPISSFPDPVSLQNVKMVKNRTGSIGGELLKRFNIIFDYQEGKMHLKKNNHFNEPFTYNTTGISIHHIGLQWIEELVTFRTELNVGSSEVVYDEGKRTSEFRYNFKLKPLYEIYSIRKNSLAEKAGLQEGDIIISINNKSAYRLSLQEMNGLLKADAGEYISINIRRNNKELNFRFLLEELL